MVMMVVAAMMSIRSGNLSPLWVEFVVFFIQIEILKVIVNENIGSQVDLTEPLRHLFAIDAPLWQANILKDHLNLQIIKSTHRKILILHSYLLKFFYIFIS